MKRVGTLLGGFVSHFSDMEQLSDTVTFSLSLEGDIPILFYFFCSIAVTDGRFFWFFFFSLCGQVTLLDCTAPAASGMQGILPAISPLWPSCLCPRRCLSQPSPWSSNTPSVLWVSVPVFAAQQINPAGHFREVLAPLRGGFMLC